MRSLLLLLLCTLITVHALCPSQGCSNGGICFPSTTTAYCQCPLGYMGADCSITKGVVVFPFKVGKYGPGWVEFFYNNAVNTTKQPYVQVRWTVPTLNYFGAILDVGWDGMTSGDTWVINVGSNGNNPQALDYYSTGRSSPNQDTKKDLNVVSGWAGTYSASGTSTSYQSVEFTRILNTGDSNDYIINNQPGHPIRFMWAVMNGNSVSNKGDAKLPMHSYMGSIGQFKIDFITGQTWELTDGVNWPQGYYDAGVITLAVLVLGILTQRDFVKRTIFGRLTHRPIFPPSYIPNALKDSSTCHNITFDFIPSFIRLSMNGIFIVACYFALVVLMIKSSQNDYADVGRSYTYVFGHVTAYHMAAAILPVTKNSIFLPLFGIGYDTAIQWHRRIGRLAFFWMILHGISQLVIWSGAIAFDINDCQFGYAPLFGTLSLVCFLIVILSSLQYCRRNHYNRFYNFHIIFVAIGYMFGLLHSINFRYLSIIPGFLWISDITLRFFNAYIRFHGTKIVSYQYYALRNSEKDSLVTVTLETNMKNVQWGDYVYVHVPEISKFQWHPFSISSYRAGSPSQLTLHMLASRSKEHSFTSQLFEMTRENKQIHPESNTPNKFHMKIHGPYRSHNTMLMSLKVVVLIAGGVGVTPCASALQYYLNMISMNRKEGTKNVIPQSLTLIWTACSDSPFIQWFPDLMYQAYQEEQIQQQTLKSASSDVEIPIASDATSSPPSSHIRPHFSFSLYNSQRAHPSKDHRGSDSRIIVHAAPVEMSNLHDSQQQQQQFYHDILPKRIHSGRPNITNILTQLSKDVKVMGFNNNDVGVMVCGPLGMIHETQQVVVDCGFHFVTEEFLL